MNCLHPIHIPNPAYVRLVDTLNLCELQGNHERVEMLEKLQQITRRYIDVPCRVCPACLRKRAQEWKGRLIREIQREHSLGNKCLFVTLTYSPKYYAEVESYKKHLATLFDNLRSKFRRTIKHWCIPELGDKGNRFHIHCIFFNVPDVLKPEHHFKRSKNGQLHGGCYLLDSLWPYGYNDVGFIKSSAVGSYLTTSYLTSAPKKNGDLFKGNLVTSNGIGTKTDVKEIERVKDELRNNGTATYSLGNSRYCYSQSWMRTNLDMLDRLSNTLNSLFKSISLGGFYQCNNKRFDDYFDYRAYVKIFYENVKLYKNCVNGCAITSDLSFNDFVLPDYVYLLNKFSYLNQNPLSFLTPF